MNSMIIATRVRCHEIGHSEWASILEDHVEKGSLAVIYLFFHKAIDSMKMTNSWAQIIYDLSL